MTRAQISGVIMLAFFALAAWLLGASRQREQFRRGQQQLLDDIDLERTRTGAGDDH